ncbi:hypothetical protein HZI73_05370 [Vallitalea pronyensis]|uniref:Uncharacterized protein n=1 Tax=Vallitalea pronyensis TaxID=1348613 RepID=A0A8J8MHR6_9FIRM|nr:hypothetical protein [Vallitalea pronyensis]QUI21756.1 hypothetical protein HZI73_05370 [Vallitalea pronyensis]
MTDIISEIELENKLNQFRDVLINYDYSDIDNVIFFDIQSLNHYIEHYKGNPFEKQYDAIEKILDSIYSYLPGSLPDDTINVISKILNVKYGDETIVKQNVLFNIKLEFIEMVKNISTEAEWRQLVALCKKIRSTKEKERSEGSGTPYELLGR